MGACQPLYHSPSNSSRSPITVSCLSSSVKMQTVGTLRRCIILNSERGKATTPSPQAEGKWQKARVASNILLLVLSVALVFCLGVAYHPYFWGLGALVYWSIAAYLFIRDKRKRSHLASILASNLDNCPNAQANKESKDNECSNILPRDNREFREPHLFREQTSDKEQKDKYATDSNQTSTHKIPPKGKL